jgi:hypothetical protein
MASTYPGRRHLITLYFYMSSSYYFQVKLLVLKGKLHLFIDLNYVVNVQTQVFQNLY